MVEKGVPCHRAQVVLVADDWLTVRVQLVRGGRSLLKECVSGLVFTALTLGNNYTAFARHFIRKEACVRHPVGFYGDGNVDVPAWHRLVVGRVVDPRHAVPDATASCDGFVCDTFWEPIGSLEDHVFNPMACSGRARHFVSSANPVPHPEADNGGRPYFTGKDRQAVGERVLPRLGPSGRSHSRRECHGHLDGHFSLRSYCTPPANSHISPT